MNGDNGGLEVILRIAVFYKRQMMKGLLKFGDILNRIRKRYKLVDYLSLNFERD